MICVCEMQERDLSCGCRFGNHYSIGGKKCMTIYMVIQGKYASERNVYNIHQMNRNFNKRQAKKRQ